MGKKKAKNTSIDELATMVADSFKWMDEKMTQGFRDVNVRLDGVDQRLDSMDTRLGRIENLLLRDHLNRIERLEDSMLVVKKKIGA